MTFTRLPEADGYAMPAHRPYYPPLPTYYRDVRFQLVYFQADPARLRAYLPEPLEAAEDGLCVAFGIDVPFSSSYGPFHEAGIQIKVNFRGQTGFFNSHLYLDNVPAICSGRERWGAPKEYAAVQIEQQHNLLVTRTIKDGVTIMTLTSDLGEPATPDALIPMFPSYRLKLIPRADGPGAAIKQLVTAAPQEVTTHLLYQGSGTVSFGATANSDLRALGPLAEVTAFYQVATYTETYGEVVYDYLVDTHAG
jgi:acetoacetate decarboxylase